MTQIEISTEEFLSDVSPKDKPWDVHKGQSDEVSCLYFGAGCERYAERIFACGASLVFGRTVDEKLVLVGAHFCRVRYCPNCQWRRSLMWRARFHKALPSILEQYPAARWVFLTLTVRNCETDDLRNTLREMNSAWQRLIQLSAWPALGFVRATEITKGTGGLAHPHFHCLLMVKSTYFSHNYINQEKWTQMWQRCLRVSYTPRVDVRVVRDRKTGTTDKSALSRAILETLKYTCKPDDYKDDDVFLTAITEQTYKLRFIATGGVLKDCLGDIEPKSDEDLIKVDESSEAPRAEGKPLVFGWDRPVKRYRRRKGDEA